MVGQPQKDIYEVIRDLGKYPLDAFQFVQEGLSYAVMETHGEMSPEQQELHKFMYEHEINLDRLEYLQLKFGALASAVLNHWNIRRTRDFGEIVFALVDNEFLQKQPDDSIDDFDEIYQFAEALDQSFKIELGKNTR